MAPAGLTIWASGDSRRRKGRLWRSKDYAPDGLCRSERVCPAARLRQLAALDQVRQVVLSLAAPTFGLPVAADFLPSSGSRAYGTKREDELIPVISNLPRIRFGCLLARCGGTLYGLYGLCACRFQPDGRPLLLGGAAAFLRPGPLVDGALSAVPPALRLPPVSSRPIPKLRKVGLGSR